MVTASSFIELKASGIDFANLNELYNNLKLIETHDFGGNPVATTEKLGKYTVSIIFDYVGSVDQDVEIKRLNSLFLDRGFKSFTLNTTMYEGNLRITTLFKTHKHLS